MREESTRSPKTRIAFKPSGPGILRAFRAGKFVKLDFPERRSYLGKWLVQGSTNLIYAKRGVGKSELTLWMAYSLAKGKPFLGWDVPQPLNTIVLDGEMHPSELRKRIRRIRRALGVITKSNAAQMKVVSAMLTPPPVPDLSTQEGREALTKIIGSADVVIIDNLSAWDRSGREDADSWSRLTGCKISLERA